MPEIYVPRVDQLDAVFWDKQLYTLLSEQIRKSLQYISPSLVATVEPEIETITRFLLIALPLYSSYRTFGQSLFDIHYADKHNTLKSLPFLVAVLPWFWERILPKFLSGHQTTSAAVNYVGKYLQSVSQFLSLLNFYAFLWQAKYPSVIERLLGLRLSCPKLKEIREVQYYSINQELLWHGVTDFLTFVLPFVNVYRLKGMVKRLFKPLYERQNIAVMPIRQKCGICGEVPTFPHEMGCRHVFCYYCLFSNLLADKNFSCTTCKHIVRELSNVRPVSLNSPILSDA